MAFRFAQSPAHSYLRKMVSEGAIPDWHSTDYFALSAWVRCNGGNQNQTVVWLQHLPDGTDTNWYALWLRIYNGQMWPSLTVTQNSTNYTLESATSWLYLDTAWHHLLAIVNRGNDTIYLSVDNGALENTGSIKFPSTAIDKLLISASGIFYNAMIGDIAEVALWSVPTGLLSPGNRNALAKGFNPWQVQPHGCLAYWPLLGSSASSAGDCHLTAYNDPVVSEHPTIIG